MTNNNSKGYAFAIICCQGVMLLSIFILCTGILVLLHLYVPFVRIFFPWKHLSFLRMWAGSKHSTGFKMSIGLGPTWSHKFGCVRINIPRHLSDKEKQYLPQGDLMEDLLRSFSLVLGGIFRSCPRTSQKLPLCGNQQTQRILEQLLRSLLQNPRNFSEIASEVRPAVHMPPLYLNL